MPAAQSEGSAFSDPTSIRSNRLVASGVIREGVFRCADRNLGDNLPCSPNCLWGMRRKQKRSKVPFHVLFLSEEVSRAWSMEHEEVCPLPPIIVLSCVWGLAFGFFLFCLFSAGSF